MTKSTTVLGAVLASLCVLAGSCAGPNGNQAEDLGLHEIQFDDIPVPDGLRLKKAAHSYQVESFRFGDFEYYGLMKSERAVAYMKDRMAIHGWELQDANEREADASLSFWRRPYRTDCRIWQDSSLTRMKVSVRTQVDDGGVAPE